MSTREMNDEEFVAWIKSWANSAEEDVPMQDWEMIITSSKTVPYILDILEEGKTKKWKWFLNCLYFYTGDIVKSKDIRGELRALKAFLERALNSNRSALKRWATRSEALLNNPSEFSYERWCEGGLAFEDIGD